MASRVSAKLVQVALCTALCSVPDTTSLQVPGCAVTDFPPMDRHLPWSLYAQPDGTSSNADNLDLDFVTDHDTLFFVA